MTELRPSFNIDDPETFRLDLSTPRPKELLAIAEFFETYIKAHPDAGPLPVTEGWNIITPKTAVNLLLRNPKGANRKLDASTAFYYASMMQQNEWKRTGQPLIFDTNGTGVDLQHRCYAGLISGSSFETYVVLGVEPGLFPYIDNGRSRTVANALQTVGYNGVAPIIAKVVHMAEEVRNGVYDPTGPARLSRMSPAEVLRLMPSYPGALLAARSAASNWSSVVDYIGGGVVSKTIIAYLGMKITEGFGEEVAHDFFDDVVDDCARATDHPIAALRKEVEKSLKSEKPLKKHHLLAALIKAFNAWHQHGTLGRRWMLLVNEPFPTLDAPTSDAEAEAAADDAIAAE